MKVWLALTAALPALITVALLDPGDALGIYEGWVAGILSFVLAFSGVMAGKATSQEEFTASSEAQLKIHNAQVDKLTKDLDYLSRRLIEVTAAKGETTPTTANSSTPARGTGGRFTKKS